MKDGVKNFLTRVSGPKSVLPFVVESFLGWILAFSLLSVSGYHFTKDTLLRSCRKKLSALITPGSSSGSDFYWIPLVMHSRKELINAESPERSFQKLASKVDATNEKLVQDIKDDLELRRLVSLAMRPCKASDDSRQYSKLYRRLVESWAELLRLPESIGKAPFDISVIIPCYRELGENVHNKLDLALQAATNPERIQVIVVDAGGCQNLSMIEERQVDHWGAIRIVHFTNGTGRGPTLNFGATHATGSAYCFLHSDTRLPHDWDIRLLSTLTTSDEVVSMCAFSFGIDTSSRGLNGKSLPPGIGAVETTANLRCKLWSLPYGDQCLSLSAQVFRYIGGFPDQPIMEDYEVVRYLRQRAALVSNFGLSEKMSIIPGSAALCSPRRWQARGVLYVTWMNSHLVNLYAGGATAEEIYEQYYGCTPDRQSTPPSE